MTSVFFDSNVLIYLVDNRDARKQRIAKRIVTAAISRRLDGWISVQTIAEFINVSLKKLNLPSDKVEGLLRFFDVLPIVNPDRELPRHALAIKTRYDVQFYDAMMIAAAERAGATEIYTEDLNDGQFYCNIKAVNPFKGSDASAS